MNEQSKNADFIKMLGFSLIPVHLFFYYYQLMRKNLNISFLDHIYLSLSSKLSMVNSSLLMNFLAMFILLLYAITTPLGKDKTVDKSEIIKKTGIGFMLILLSALLFMVLPYNQWGFYVYATGLAGGYYLYMSNIAVMLQLVQLKKTEEFNAEKETFPQMRLQVPYWAKNYIAPCKLLIVSNLQGYFLSYFSILPSPYFVNIKA